MITGPGIAKLPEGRSLREPMTSIVTFFGVGLLPVGPGTWGTAAAMPFGWLFATLGGWPLLLAAGIAATIAGFIASDAYVRATGRDDPPEVVIDEVATIWLVMLAVPMTFNGLLAAFLVFRVFDTLKPWPASWADQTVEGGVGVMLDDLFAGAYAILVLVALNITGFL
jgi:phosphatidylglycerophosphatase A